MSNVRRSRRNQGLPPPPSNEEQEGSNDDQHPEQSEQNDAEEKQIETGQVPIEQIPVDVEPTWIGFNTTQNKIINGNGEIIYDMREALDQTHDEGWRDKKYHQHKKYVIKQIRSIFEKSHGLSFLYTINRERLGLPGSVACRMFSPLFYERKHQDLMKLLSNVMNYVTDEIQERGMLSSNVNLNNDDLMLFMWNFREKMQRNDENLLQFYDQGLCEIFNKGNVNDVLTLLRQAAEANENDIQVDQDEQMDQDEVESMEQDEQ